MIELMIVVAIIGILAAVAMPKFADLVRKSKEGATKGSLGAVRSALSIYYADNEGMWPLSLAGMVSIQIAGAASGAKYLDAIPSCKLGCYGHADLATEVVIDTGLMSAGVTDVGGWLYDNTIGAVAVNCNHTDTKGTKYTAW